MTDAFKANLREVRRNVCSTLHPTQALPILATLLKAELEHDRHVSRLTAAHEREATSAREMLPVLRLLLAAVELAGQPSGIEEDRYEAAIAAASAILNHVQDGQEPGPHQGGMMPPELGAAPAPPAFDFL